jgi:hypothetical protein
MSAGDKLWNDVKSFLEDEKSTKSYEARKEHNSDDPIVKQIDKVEKIIDEFKDDGNVKNLMDGIFQVEDPHMLEKLQGMYIDFITTATPPTVEMKDAETIIMQGAKVEKEEEKEEAGEFNYFVHELQETELKHMTDIQNFPLLTIMEKIKEIHKNPNRAIESKMQENEVLSFFKAFGELREAQKELSKAILSNPEDPQYFKKIAQAHAKMLGVNAEYSARYFNSQTKFPKDIKDELAKLFPKDQNAAANILITPVQRTMRYAMQMESIIKGAEKANLDTKSMVAALDEIKETNGKMNTIMARKELSSENPNVKEKAIQKIRQGLGAPSVKSAEDIRKEKEAASKAKVKEKEAAKVKQDIADVRKDAASAKKDPRVKEDAAKIKGEYIDRLNNLDMKFFDISRFDSDKKDYTKEEVKEIIASFDVTEFAKRFDQDAAKINEAVKSQNNNEIKYYVELMQESIVNNNYAHAAALFNGFTNNEQEIKDKDIKKVLGKLYDKNYFSLLQGAKVYKADMDQAKGTYVPLTSITAKDLVAITDKLKEEINTLVDDKATVEEKEEARDVLKFYAELWNKEMKKMVVLQQKAGKKVDDKALLTKAAELTTAKKPTTVDQPAIVKPKANISPIVIPTKVDVEPQILRTREPKQPQAKAKAKKKKAAEEEKGSRAGVPQSPEARRPTIRAKDPRAVVDAINQNKPGRAIPKPISIEAQINQKQADDEKIKPPKPVIPKLDLEKVPKAPKDARKVSPEQVVDIRVIEGAPKQAAPKGAMVEGPTTAEKISRSEAVPKSIEAKRRAPEEPPIKQSMVQSLIHFFDKKEDKPSEKLQSGGVETLDKFNKLLGVPSEDSKEKSPAFNALDLGEPSHSFAPHHAAVQKSANPLHLKSESVQEIKDENKDEKKSGVKRAGH